MWPPRAARRMRPEPLTAQGAVLSATRKQFRTALRDAADRARSTAAPSPTTPRRKWRAGTPPRLTSRRAAAGLTSPVPPMVPAAAARMAADPAAAATTTRGVSGTQFRQHRAGLIIVRHFLVAWGPDARLT